MDRQSSSLLVDSEGYQHDLRFQEAQNPGTFPRGKVSLSLMLLLHIFSSFFMTGLIWLIQLVHYPTFHQIDESSFLRFTDFHGTRITWIVAPIMSLELATGLFQFCILQDVFWGSQMLLIAGIWAGTAFLSVPCHNELRKKRSKREIEKLVSSNWLRTILWSVRSLCLIFYLH